MGDFAHLHTHSHFSLRDAVAKVPDIVKKAHEDGQSAIALTEHGTMASAFELWKEAKKVGIKPVFGVEAYVAPRTRFDKDKELDMGYYHLVLLAMNEEGLRNLFTIVTESYKKDVFYRKPRIDKELLRRHNEGIICTSACLGSELSKSILKRLDYHYDGEDKVKVINPNPDEVIEFHKSTFGDRYYIEIMKHNIPAEDAVTQYVLENYKRWGVKLIATNDSHYLNPEDAELHKLMFAIRDRTTILDEKAYQFSGTGYHLKTTKEMRDLFSDIPEAIDNTMEIVERCNVEFDTNKSYYPHYEDIYQDDQLFIKAAEEGLKKRLNGNVPQEYWDRLYDEISTIVNMGFSSYFLVVADILNWSREQGIITSPGRGSAAGSLVSYAMNITGIDPIKHNLSFARFLNKGRAADPQISFPEYTYEQFLEEQQ